MKPSKADIGQQVRYWKNGWHFAKLLAVGRRWVKLASPTGGRKSPVTGQRLPFRVPVAMVESLTSRTT
jgi:hypothetical protein